jgi:hypothetical protein
MDKTDPTAPVLDLKDAWTLSGKRIRVEDIFALALQIGNSLRAGTRYNDDGSVADSSAFGVYIDSSGTLKVGSPTGQFEIDAAFGSAGFENIPIRSYKGALNERTATQLDSDSLDWLDTPVGGSELLRARIGRFGVGANILLEGNMFTEMPAQNPVTLAAYTSANQPRNLSVIALPDGSIECFFSYAATPYGLYSLNRNAQGTWSASITTHFTTNIARPQVTRLLDGRYFCTYYDNTALGYRYRIYNPSLGTWGAAVSLSIDASTGIRLRVVQTDDGLIHIGYSKNTVFTSCEVTLDSGLNVGPEKVIFPYSTLNLTYCYMTSGVLRAAAIDSSSGKVYTGYYNTSSGLWVETGSPVSSGQAIAQIFENLKGSVFIYATSTSGAVVEYAYSSGTTWSVGTSIATLNGASHSVIHDVQGARSVLYVVSSTTITEYRLPNFAKLGAGIIESGSNANGSYLKFSDGTLIQWGRKLTATLNVPIDNNFGNTSGRSYYNGENDIVYFPISFIDTNYSVNLSSSGQALTSTVRQANTMGRVYVIKGVALPASYIDWVAIGRWKA